MNGSHGNWTNWTLSKKAPKYASQIFNNLKKGDARHGNDTFCDLMGTDEFSVLDKDEITVEEIILEYELKVNPPEYDPSKLVFFSFRENNSTRIGILDGLSRYAKKDQTIEAERANFEADEDYYERRRREILQRDKDSLMKTRAGRKEYERQALTVGIHDAFVADEITCDDTILWFDYLEYGNSFAFIKSAEIKYIWGSETYDAPLPKGSDWSVVCEE